MPVFCRALETGNYFRFSVEHSVLESTLFWRPLCFVEHCLSHVAEYLSFVEHCINFVETIFDLFPAYGLPGALISVYVKIWSFFRYVPGFVFQISARNLSDIWLPLSILHQNCSEKLIGYVTSKIILPRNLYRGSPFLISDDIFRFHEIFHDFL